MDIVSRLLWGWDARLHAPDQFGKVALVTGANSGIGLETALRLAERRATVIMGVRDAAAGQRAAESIRYRVPGAKLLVWHADVGSFRSVRAFADRVDASFPGGIDVLVNNAGVLNPPGGSHVTEDGIEVTRAVNFFGPALLTHLLLPGLARAAPSRVVNMCSLGEAVGALEWDDLRGAERGAAGASFHDYACAKLMLLVWSRELHRRLAGAGVDVFAVHPGVVATPGEWKTAPSRPSSWATWLSSLVHGQGVGWGATSTLFAATEPWLAGRGGCYIGPSYIQLFGYASSNTAVRPPLNLANYNPGAARRLFDETTAILLLSLNKTAAAAGAPAGDAPGVTGKGGASPLPSPDELAAAALAVQGQLGAAGVSGKGRLTAAGAGADEPGMGGEGWAGGEDLAALAATAALVAEAVADVDESGGGGMAAGEAAAGFAELVGALEEVAGLSGLRCRRPLHAAAQGGNNSSSDVQPQQQDGAQQRPCPLPPPPDLGGATPSSRWNAASLAYLGDSVWEVQMRTASHRDGPWQTATANAVVRLVNTKALAAAHDLLTASPGLLTADERATLKWAANSATVAAPPHATRLEYKRATAFEVLVAHLYLTDLPRLEALTATLMRPEVQPRWAGRTGEARSAAGTPLATASDTASDAESDDGLGDDGAATAADGGDEQQQQQQQQQRRQQQQPRSKAVGFGGSGGQSDAKRGKKS